MTYGGQSLFGSTVPEGKVNHTEEVWQQEVGMAAGTRSWQITTSISVMEQRELEVEYGSELSNPTPSDVIPQHVFIS